MIIPILQRRSGYSKDKEPACTGFGEWRFRQREQQGQKHVWGNAKEACVAGAELS